MSKPKLGDVAACAGVSPTTVSRVLNNRGYLSQRTREKVYDAMRELGYRPNAIARSLKGQRSRIVGLVFPTVANPFYAEMVYRIESFLADAGYRVILCNSDDHPDLEEQYFEMLLSNQVDGIITGAHSQVVANLPHVQAPLVTVDRPGTQKYPNIRADNYAGARMAVEHLVATGARNILHITSTVSEQNLRLAGYRDAVTAAGMTPQVLELGFRTPLPRKRELIERYLKESTAGERVDAVFASNDTYAAMALNWARTRNLCVPQDFQVVGFDGTETVRALIPELATVVQPIEQIAARAVQRLLQTIESGRQGRPDDTPSPHESDKEQQGSTADVFPVHLHEGGTLRAITVSS